MKNFALLLLLVCPLLSIGQVNEISINYGFIKTTYYHNDVDVGKVKFKSIVQTDQSAFKIFKQGRILMTTGTVITVPGVLLLAITLENQSSGNTPYAWQWIAGAGGTITGILLYYAGKKKTLEGVKFFNTNARLSLGIGRRNGAGILVTF